MWVVPLGGFTILPGLSSQLMIGGSVAGRTPSQAREDCCISISPSMTLWRLCAKYPARLVASVLLPTPPLGFMTTTTGMEIPPEN